MRVLLLGSYNGQDSLGDKGLLSSVAAQLKHRLGPDTAFISHVANTEPGFSPEGIAFKTGAWQIMGPCAGRISWLAFSPVLHLACTFSLIPIWLIFKASNRSIWNEFRKDCRQCDALYFYGGTQLSTQWFDLNFPSILLTVIAFRLQGKPVYFGPQQYGPLTPRQCRWLRLVIRWFVTDYRTRNEKCLELLAAPREKLTLDEIYSCTLNYPADPTEKTRGDYLIANFRGVNFLSDYGGAEVDRFCTIIKQVCERLNCPVRVLQMSGASFCDDSGIVEKLRQRNVAVELLPHTHHEVDVIGWAKNSVGCVSMSFHGCILTMLAGRPAVPVTSGGYYDHKYLDFDRYSGNQHVPLTSLEDADVENATQRIIDYFDRFSPEILLNQRRSAASLLDAWYGSIAASLKKRPRKENS